MDNQFLLSDCNVPFLPCGAADERHVVVGAEAVDGLVERLIPAAHERPAASVEQPRRGVVPGIPGLVNQESSQELIPSNDTIRSVQISRSTEISAAIVIYQLIL